MPISFVNAGSNSSANSGNLPSLSLPPGWTTGDIFICTIASRDNVNSTMPPGWIALDAGTNNGTDLRTTTFYRIAASGDTNPTVTHLNGGRIEGMIVGYRGADNINPIDRLGAVRTNPSSTTVTANSITTLTNTSWVIFAGSISSRSTFSAYSGTPIPIERADAPNRANFASTFITDFVMSPAGSTGNRTAIATSAGTSNGLMFALKPLTAPTNTATLVCITDPTDANIYIDGILQPTVTSGPIYVLAGTHTVTFSNAGYNSYTTTVTVTTGQVINVCAILTQIANILDSGIVICTIADIASCPTTPVACPATINPLYYINLIATINSTIPTTITVRFTYTLDSTTYYDDITVNIVTGTNIVYAWSINRRYDVNSIITLIDVSIIS